MTESEQIEIEQTAASPRNRRWSSPKLLVPVLAAAVLIAGGGIWLGVDSSKKRIVPDLVGLTLRAAEQEASDVDLVLATDIEDDVKGLSDSNTEVEEQHPEAGSVLRTGESVQVVVVGREALVPELVGLPFTEAKKSLVSAGFVLQHRFGRNTPPDTWLIAEQSPSAGGEAAAGSRIEIEFDVPEILMPDLSGVAVGEASALLAEAGLLVNLSGDGTHVASMSEVVGAPLEPFTRVTLTAGYMMPNVIGKTSTEARELLSSFENVTTSGHPSRPITSQSIPAGQFTSKDTEITLTSPGPETVYRIFGNGSKAMITWVRPGGFDIQQATDASLPWETRFETDSGTAIFSGQIYDGDSITCQLERNGKVVKELTSTGPYAVVQC